MMDTHGSNAVKNFLRTETFYILIAIMVICITIGKASSIVGRKESKLVVRAPMAVGEFPKLLDSKVEALRKAGDDDRAAPALILRRAEKTILYIGMVVLALAIMVFAVFFNHIRIDPLVRAPWTLWDCFKLGACWSLGGILLGHVFSTGGDAPMTHPQFWFGEIFGVLLLIGILLSITIGERRMHLRDLGITSRGAATAIGLGIAGFLLMQPIYFGIQQMQIPLMQEMPIHATLDAMITTQSVWTLVLISITAVVVVPIGEELLFRGFLQSALQEWFGKWTGLVVCALIFGTAHAATSVAAILPMFALGLILGIIYNHTKSLLAPVTLHILHNGATIATVFVFRHIYSIPAN
jgi:CAAX protease family protein